MPNPENVIGKGTPFTSENQPANRGRKPKLYTIAKKAYGISLAEFNDGMVYLMQLTKKELKEVICSEETPVWMINIAQALHKDTSKGTMNALREITDRLWGKPKQQIDTAQEVDDRKLLPRSEFLSYRPNSADLPPIQIENVADE